MSDPNRCSHARTALIAKDADAEFIECLDCGVILETGELSEPNPTQSLVPAPAFDESLQDA